MRVLHVITGLGIGGAEHQLRLLLRYLPHECEVVTLTNPGPIAGAISGDGTPVHMLDMRGNRDLSALPRLVRLMRAGRFDVVHTHLYRACVYGRIAARVARIPGVVATEHSLGDGVIEGRRATFGVRALYLATERLSAATIAVSAAVAQRLVAWGVPHDRVRVIPNGIDLYEWTFDPVLRRTTRARLGIPPNVPVVGAVGRLEPTKRFDTLIRAFAGLPDARLLLVGDGSARAELQRLAAESGVADRVVFAGEAAHARGMFCAMDVFASPSPDETFGMAVLEALASGLPTVYASCPPLEGAALSAARRVPSREPELRAALAEHLARIDADTTIRPHADTTIRLPVPAVVAAHDIALLAGAVGRLYERIALRSSPTSRQIGSETA